MGELDIAMTTSDVYFDMYDRETFAAPYDALRRLRDEAPLYYNEQFAFYAVSRYTDVARVLSERETFISGKGMTYEILKACVDMGLTMPDGLFICEDAPQHTMHRSLVSRLFTPRAVNSLEPQIRDLTREVLAPVANLPRFDFMAEVANRIPIRVIGMLLGLPKADQAELHGIFHQNLHADSTSPDGDALSGIVECAAWFDRYLDERAERPTDDVMTQLLHMELTDETGATRKLRRDEILTYLTLIASAGADTTAMALGWAIKALGENPDQRKILMEDRTLMPNAVEEIIRYEAVSYHASRFVAHDVELHGQTVPAGSAMVVLPPAANRDERQFPNPDDFDIRRAGGQNFSFGFGPHFCLGASLARLELRVAIDVILDTLPSWTVDAGTSSMVSGINTRGWERLTVEV
jgi:cytochrome P450